MSPAAYPVPASVMERLRGARSILLATHENPDADGFGSVIACALALPRLGYSVARLGPEHPPRPLDQLPGVSEVALDDGSATYDLVILFDCHSASRLGADEPALERCREVLVIDHHPAISSELLDPEAWIVDTAASTTLMVHSLILALDGQEALGPSAASSLYAGLVVDTGGFRHASTTSDTLRSAAELVDAGADAPGITELFLHRRRPAAICLVSAVLAKTRYEVDGRIALLAVPLSLLASCDAREEEAESLVSIASAIEGVQLAVMHLEIGSGRWRVSLRAHKPLRVDSLARANGGGGHLLAAGFRTSGDLVALQEELLPGLRAELDGGGVPG
ncbi:hypothetical protein DRQ53_00100 [bacterium]|nr:MAG: hypothetical protein DRQ53_00100 [bacterium]